MNTSHKASIAIAIIVALGLGAVLGGTIANSIMSDDMSKAPATVVTPTSTNKADLRVALNNLLREHVTTNLAVNYAIASGAPASQISAAEAAQTANAVAIAGAVGSIYGDEAKTAVTTPFVEHLVQSNNYAKAVQSGDMAAQEASLTALRVQLRNVADVFNSVMPTVSSDDLYAALSAHEDLINESTIAYKNGDYAKAYQLQNDALTQISGGAEVLVGGIAASKPDLYE